MEKRIVSILVVLILLFTSLLMAAHIGYSPSATSEGVRSGYVLMSSQIAWNVLNASVAAGDEPTDLAVDERTYTTVVAAIATAASGDGKISYARIPPTWNGVRFRCIGTTNNATVTYQIYAGTLGDGTDCEIAKVGQAAWTVGQQVSTTSTYEMADSLTWTARLAVI